MKYTITFCGPAKDYFRDASYTITSDTTLNATELKKLLIASDAMLSIVDTEQALSIIHSSVIATETHILPNAVDIIESEKLFLIPPVCGG